MPAPRSKARTRGGSVLVARSRALGLAGAIALFAGVFAPSIGGLMIGTRSYFQYAQLEASILLLLAGASYVLVLLRAYSRLWLTGLAALGTLATTLVVFSVRLSEAKAHARRWLEDNPFQGYSEPVLDTIQLQWGWIVLLAGAVLLLSAAFFSKR